ncbi:MAG TPA: hypothetical protein PKD55_03470 [Bellilinea sp.]|nr:hypothetical protein [Bellilinea sp.]
MEENVIVTEEEKPVVTGPDLYHHPAKLSRVASIANVVSWIVLVIVLAIFVEIAYTVITSVAGAAGMGVTFTQIFEAFFTPLLFLGLGLFIFAVLQWMSEVVYLWMDIEENTRK